MAILPQERTENVKRALFDYIATNFTETAIQFQGSNVLDTTAQTEWTWFGITGSSRRYVRQTRSNFGNLVTFFIQAIIYVKPTQSITRIDAIRDAVANLLRKASIQVVDRIGGTGNLGKLYGREILSDVPLGVENDIMMHSLTFAFDYLEEFS